MSLFILLCAVSPVLAQNTNTPSTDVAASSGPLIFMPQVTIPGGNEADPDTNFVEQQSYTLKNDTSPIVNYIKAFYKYGTTVVGIIAAIFLMIGGLLWLTAAGNDSKIGQAKEFIFTSLSGLILVFAAQMLLKTVNPDLVNLTVRSLPSQKTIGEFCCELANGKGALITKTEQECAEAPGAIIRNSIVEDGHCSSPGCCVYTASTNATDEDKMCINTSKGRCNRVELLPDFLPTVGATAEKMFPLLSQLSDPRSAVVINFKENVDCATVAGCTDEKTTSCAGNINGDLCYNLSIGKLVQSQKMTEAEAVLLGAESDNAYCYKNMCFSGDGGLNEPCGNDQGSFCGPLLMVNGLPTCAGGGTDSGGRDCGSNLSCCETPN